MVDNISVFHSSIRIEGSKIIYFDPFKIKESRNDADLIFISHSHFDHYSPEDILKVLKEDTIIVIPKSIKNEVSFDNTFIVEPNNEYLIKDIKFKTILAYNIGKKFHPKENNWVGYVIELDGTSYYVAGDTDITDESINVKCDVALLPCGGTYTMNALEAAELANIISPSIAIPTHYGEVAGSYEDGNTFISKLKSEIQGVIKIRG